MTVNVHAYMIQHFEMSFALYDRAMLDACFSLRQLSFLSSIIILLVMLQPRSTCTITFNQKLLSMLLLCLLL